MKKVIIALDYSPSATKVAEAGYELAATMSAKVVLVHVITEPAWYNEEKLPFMGLYHGCNTGTTALAKDIRKQAERFLAASAKKIGDNSIATVVLEGKPADAILKYGEDSNADLIVMGSHRHQGLDRLFAAYEATHLLAHSKIRLLTVPIADDKAGRWV